MSDVLTGAKWHTLLSVYSLARPGNCRGELAPARARVLHALFTGQANEAKCGIYTGSPIHRLCPVPFPVITLLMAT